MRILSVVGTRPQIIKAAALQPVLRSRHEEIFVDTGQHWDEAMAGTFFSELGLVPPDHALGAGGGSHAKQTAAMLLGLEPILIAEQPDVVLVYGDTNSTLAGALAASKLGTPVAHVEAGLRSFDRRMPEEINRVVADHLSAWLFAPTPSAVGNLRAEGIVQGVTLVGDLMQDLAARTALGIRDPHVLAAAEAAITPLASRQLELAAGRYLFATIHRAENREPAAVAAWAALLRRVALPDRPVVLALHPGTRAVIERLRVDIGPNVAIVDPTGYRTSLALQLHAAAVLTDSGGVQREAAWLGTPCLVLRTTTEWDDMVAASRGRVVVVGLDADRAEAALASLAPRESASALAGRRVSELDLPTVGAAEAILAALEPTGREG